MANEYIDKIKIGTEEYNIWTTGADWAGSTPEAAYAKNAASVPNATKADKAGVINSTAYIRPSGDLTGNNFYISAFTTSTYKHGMTIKNVPWGAVSADTPNGAMGAATDVWTSDASSNSGFVTPSGAKSYIDNTVSSNLSGVGIYLVKGSKTVSQLTTNTDLQVLGYVYNVTTSGETGGTSSLKPAYNNLAFEVQPGDNVVWLVDYTDATKTTIKTQGWDKLGNSMTAEMSKLQPFSGASAKSADFDSMVATVTSAVADKAQASGWYNTAHSAFSVVKYASDKSYTATACHDTFTVSGDDFISVTGTGATATIGMQGWSGFKSISANTVKGTALTANKSTAGSLGANLTINRASNSNLTFTTTVGDDGRPLIKISKTDTTAAKATKTAAGGVQQTYYQEKDTTNHIGVAVIQGNMTSKTWAK